MKKCSPSLAIKEKQIKTILRFYVTPVRVATIKKANNNKYWQGFANIGRKESLCTAGGNVNEYNPFGKQYRDSSTN
jgi:hypothetical protein